jgi:hypothetical protein
MFFAYMSTWLERGEILEAGLNRHVPWLACLPPGSVAGTMAASHAQCTWESRACHACRLAREGIECPSLGSCPRLLSALCSVHSAAPMSQVMAMVEKAM